MDSAVPLQLVILILLILLSAFFSSAETALTTVNKLRVQTLSWSPICLEALLSVSEQV